jgi:hypothetical protein
MVVAVAGTEGRKGRTGKTLLKEGRKEVTEGRDGRTGRTLLKEGSYGGKEEGRKRQKERTEVTTMRCDGPPLHQRNSFWTAYR